MGWLVENEAKQESSPFADWLKSVPPGAPLDADGNVTVSLELNLSASQWMQLAQGASRNGWTLEKCVQQLIADGSPGLSEWANNDFQTPDEQVQSRLLVFGKGGAR